MSQSDGYLITRSGRAICRKRFEKLVSPVQISILLLTSYQAPFLPLLGTASRDTEYHLPLRGHRTQKPVDCDLRPRAYRLSEKDSYKLSVALVHVHKHCRQFLGLQGRPRMAGSGRNNLLFASRPWSSWTSSTLGQSTSPHGSYASVLQPENLRLPFRVCCCPLY